MTTTNSVTRANADHDEDELVARRTLVAAIYDRVSQDKRQNRRSVDQQNAANAKVCEAHGWRIGAEYEDNDRSASRHASRGREQWPKLRADLDDGKFDVLVLWEPSRGDRELELWAGLLNACRRQGVLIHITSHNRTYDVRQPRDWRTLAEDGVDSAFESEKNRERIKRAMAANAEAGVPHGRITYGYERVYDPKTKELVEQREHPENAPVVREIIQRVAQSEPIIRIERDFNARGVRPPQGSRWWGPTIRSIAMNPVYIGKRRYQGEVLDGNWPPLVDEATFWTAQNVLGDERRKTTRPGKHRWLLSYLATCGVCGAQLHVIPARPGRRAHTYHCTGAKGCTSLRVALLDEHVTALVCARLADPEMYRRLARADDADAVAARAEAERWRADLEEWRQAAEAGTVTPATMGRVEADRLAKIAAAETRAQRAALPAVAWEIMGDDEDATAEDIAARWEQTSIAARKELLRALCTIRLHPTPVRGSHKFDPARVEITWTTPGEAGASIES